MSENVLDGVHLLKDAEEKFEIAMNHFNHASSEFFDDVNQELTDALCQLNNVRKVLNMPAIEL